MRRVLILAYYFPPIAASGSLRPAGFCAHLPSLDYEPLVLSADYRDVHPPIAVDESLSSLVPSEVDVRLISYVNWQKRLLTVRDSLRHVFKQSSTSQPEADSIKNDDARGAGFNLKSEILNRLFRFPDQQRGWGRAATKYAANLDESHRPELVFATANPWSALVSGAKIAAKFNVPFVADFRDPWVNNPKPPLTPSLGKKARQVENEIIRQATCVIANTPELAESFRSRYPSQASKFVAITNGFHQSLVDKFAKLPPYTPAGQRVELCYFGSVYELRKPTLLLQCLKEMLDEDVPNIDRILLRFTGNWIVTDSNCNALAMELEERGTLCREANVNHDEYLARLKSSQILLVLQQEFPLQIPAKIYEYMASGRPSIVIGGDGATANLVQRAGIGKVCRNSKEEIKTLLTEISANSESIMTPKVGSTGRYAYPNLTRELAQCFDSAIEEFHAF